MVLLDCSRNYLYALHYWRPRYGATVVPVVVVPGVGVVTGVALGGSTTRGTPVLGTQCLTSERSV